MQHIAELIGGTQKDIVFTSGATESNNLAIKGVARFNKAKKRHIITTQTEHKCVLDSCRNLQDEGFDVTYLPVAENGLVDLAQLEAAIRPDTCLVSVMMVNNEIGTIQPIKEIGKIVKKYKGVYLHVDGAQAVGKSKPARSSATPLTLVKLIPFVVARAVPVNVDELNIDLLSISAHKIYGPKGIGALYVRRRPRVRLEPIISGGGQERGLRSGTVAAPLAVGFGEACRLAKKEMAVSDGSRLSGRLRAGQLKARRGRRRPLCGDDSFPLWRSNGPARARIHLERTARAVASGWNRAGCVRAAWLEVGPPLALVGQAMISCRGSEHNSPYQIDQTCFRT